VAKIRHGIIHGPHYVKSGKNAALWHIHRFRARPRIGICAEKSAAANPAATSEKPYK
jgi:hypothetical protein